MPNRDGTGPNNEGSGTGRGDGDCKKEDHYNRGKFPYREHKQMKNNQRNNSNPKC